jgi:hypothetical protein
MTGVGWLSVSLTRGIMRGLGDMARSKIRLPELHFSVSTSCTNLTFGAWRWRIDRVRFEVALYIDLSAYPFSTKCEGGGLAEIAYCQ